MCACLVAVGCGLLAVGSVGVRVLGVPVVVSGIVGLLLVTVGKWLPIPSAQTSERLFAIKDERQGTAQPAEARRRELGALLEEGNALMARANDPIFGADRQNLPTDIQRWTARVWAALSPADRAVFESDAGWDQHLGPDEHPPEGKSRNLLEWRVANLGEILRRTSRQ
ncbi:MAG: hypothetical protein ACRDZ8_13490 [Acidimicrobiales bacterium]